MNRKRWIGASVGAVLLVGVVFAGVLVAQFWQPKQPPPPPGQPGGAFVPLDKFVQDEIRFHPGWEPHILPKEPGPFRHMTYRGGMLSASNGGKMKSTARSDDGRVEDEIELEASPNFDYLVRHIESESGRRCLLVLKRPR